MHVYSRLEECGQAVLVGREVSVKKSVTRTSAADGIYVVRCGNGWAVVQRQKSAAKTLVTTNSESDAERIARKYNGFAEKNQD